MLWQITAPLDYRKKLFQIRAAQISPNDWWFFQIASIFIANDGSLKNYYKLRLENVVRLIKQKKNYFQNWLPVDFLRILALSMFYIFWFFRGLFYS